MKQALNLRLGQSLSLTPQLQQAIKLLQLSAAELETEIAEQVAANPYLDYQPAVATVAVSANGETNLRSESASEAHAEFAGSDGEYQAGVSLANSSRAEEDEDFSAGRTLKIANVTLREHLLQQIRLLPKTAENNAAQDAVTIAMVVIAENVHNDGYLTEPEESLVAQCVALYSLNPESSWSEILQIAESQCARLDPPGVGARTVQACLLAQLQHPHPAECILDAKVTTHKLAIQIVQHGFAAMAARDRVLLRRQMGCDEAMLSTALRLIRQLDAKPGLAFAPEDIDYVLPDILVENLNASTKNSALWRARLNPAVVPQLSVNAHYAALLKAQKKLVATPHIQDAKLFVRAVAQRFETLLRVAQAITLEQQAYFSVGNAGLAPMILSDIAAQLDLHESTISRCTANKFLLSPQGTVELKFFFTSRITSDKGDDISSTAIKSFINAAIGGESSQKPLSDQGIADRLSAAGYPVARRTVAKYREALGFPAAHARKPL